MALGALGARGASHKKLKAFIACEICRSVQFVIRKTVCRSTCAEHCHQKLMLRNCHGDIASGVRVMRAIWRIAIANNVLFALNVLLLMEEAAMRMAFGSLYLFFKHKRPSAPEVRTVLKQRSTSLSNGHQYKASSFHLHKISLKSININDDFDTKVKHN